MVVHDDDFVGNLSRVLLHRGKAGQSKSALVEDRDND